MLQCRPFKITKTISEIENLSDVKDEDLLLKTSGPFIGQSVFREIDKLIYVVPENYSKLNTSRRYTLAQLIGRLSNSFDKNTHIMLMGPGRWGSTMPELGIPVSFGDIKNVSVLCELAVMHEGLVPDISLGTHFFNDLVEMGILYIALFPDRKDYVLNRESLDNSNNSLLKIMPDAAGWEDTIMVIDKDSTQEKSRLFLHADTLKQEGSLFLAR